MIEEHLLGRMYVARIQVQVLDPDVDLVVGFFII